MSLRILVVDDDVPGLRALAGLLAMAGHEVHTAANGREAVSLAGQRRCDLLIADLGLPDCTGLDLIRELRGMYFMEGIVLSGDGDEDTLHGCKDAGFAKHLLKPLIFNDLIAAIKELHPTGNDDRCGARDANPM